MEKIPRARAHLLTNLPWAGEREWNWPLWCFHMRMLRSCWLRGVLLCGVAVLWLQWSEGRREAACGRGNSYLPKGHCWGSRGTDQLLALIRASVPRACLFPTSNTLVDVTKSLMPSPQALPHSSRWRSKPWGTVNYTSCGWVSVQTV